MYLFYIDIYLKIINIIMKHIKLFNQHSDYETYINNSNKVLPNISYCKDQNDIHYNPWIDNRFVATINVTSTSEPTKIAANGQLFGPYGMVDVNVTNNFTEIEIDGVKLSSISDTYTFSTLGEHTIKYTLTDVETIPDGTFHTCSNFTNIVIPNSVTTIGTGAFQGCTGLTNVIMPNSITSIDRYAFGGCTGLTSVIISNSVTSLQDIFSGCTNLTNITIPNSVTTIGNSTFYYCSSLTNITIPNTVTSIGIQAFFHCEGLTNITIPNTVTSIDSNAFYYCTGLTSVTVQATTPPTLGASAFNNNASGRKIYVPSASVDTYKAAANWSTYAADIEAI